MVISAPMLGELATVLNRPKIKNKFKIENDNIIKLLDLLENRAEDVCVLHDVSICRDSDDDVVIETAIRGKVSYLVTRDDDIKRDKKISAFLSKHGVKVISLSKFIGVINKS